MFIVVCRVRLENLCSVAPVLRQAFSVIVLNEYMWRPLSFLIYCGLVKHIDVLFCVLFALVWGQCPGIGEISVDLVSAY